MAFKHTNQAVVATSNQQLYMEAVHAQLDTPSAEVSEPSLLPLLCCSTPLWLHRAEAAYNSFYEGDGKVWDGSNLHEGVAGAIQHYISS